MTNNINAESIRCSNDLKRYKALLEDQEVKRANEQIEKLEEEGPTGVRRQLLATSIRLSRGMAKGIHIMADECVEKLEMDIPLELYVFSSPQFNAACFKPEDGRLFVMFSSALLEAFEGSELRFVIGHEFGHHVYNHHQIPIGYMLRGANHPNPKLALELFTWSRYAEISADRAGAHCAQDLNGVARSLFKLASGLSSKKIVQFSFDDFVRQVDEMQIEHAEPGQGAPEADWFSTHPFSPLRVKALKLFHDSELAGATMSRPELEVAVQGVMGLMEPSYLEGRTDSAESMRRLLFAAAVAVADASGGISDEEKAVFEDFFGKGSFHEDLNIKKLKAQLGERIEDTTKQASRSQAMQVIRDLCIVARAEGNTSAAERQVLDRVAKGLSVPERFVTQVLNAALEPD
jgi:tellurite resistance protein